MGGGGGGGGAWHWSVKVGELRMAQKNFNNPKDTQNLDNLLQNESQEIKDNFSTGDNCMGTICLFPSISPCKRELSQKRAQVCHRLLSRSSTHSSCCISEHKSLLELGYKLMYCNEWKPGREQILDQIKPNTKRSEKQREKYRLH